MGATLNDESLTGRTLADYALIEELGHGAMGVVYKAKDTTLRRLAAVKVLPLWRELNRDSHQLYDVGVLIS